MPHPAIQFFLSILSTLVAYAVFLILLPFTLLDRSLIRKVLSWVESKPALRVLFAQNLEILEAILVMPSVMWKLALVIPLPMVCPVLLLAEFREEYCPFCVESDAFL